MPEVWFEWGFWYAVGGAIVLVAALLLIAILVTAAGIEREAERVLDAVERIETGTRAIWQLADARDAVERVRFAAESIADRLETLADVLHGEVESREAKR